MKVYRSLVEPVRLNIDWEDKWHSSDQGLIACWERGREKKLEDESLCSQATAGQLVLLPWKGGVEKATKKNRKYGTLRYLAMWQGLRGEDLNVDTSEEVFLTCTATNTTVVFTEDVAKYADAQS